MKNNKSSITLKNRTNYFIPDKDKVKITFSSPKSYQSKSIKQEAFETRLYYQFDYCNKNNGQTFFYTLTYNDKAMPNHYGMNCFDYEDLRDLLTGGFRKQLLRKYGTTFKYAISAELGDGKGERGMHNNPHYHCLLFTENANNPKFPYVKISETEMTNLIKLYWQGFTNNQDYKTAKYGIVKEGEYGAIVQSYQALNYVSKYVCKDIYLIENEKNIKNFLKYKYTKEYENSEEVAREFFYKVIYPMYNTPLNAKHTKWSFTDTQLINELDPDAFEIIKLAFGEIPEKITNYDSYINRIITKHSLWNKYYQFLDEYIQPKIKERINEWRNRFSNKPRISQGVGITALDAIKDKMNPGIPVPGKNGIKTRPISMYYYRKLYCDTVKDKKTKQNMYILNELGQKYKLAKLPLQINKKIEQANNNLNMIKNNRELYNKMRNSDINTIVEWDYDTFQKQTNKLLQYDNIQNILKRYAEYKLVYENRFFTYKIDRSDTSIKFPDINVYNDYKRFLVPSYLSIPRNDLMLDVFLEDIPENYLPYSTHKYFTKYRGIFAVLDMCADYLFVQNDNKKQKDAEERAETRRFHNQRKLKEFYQNFK